MFEKRKLRKQQLEQRNTITDIALMKLRKEIYGTAKLVCSASFYKKLITSINPITHISLYERLKATVDRHGRMFLSITISDELLEGFDIKRFGV